MERTGLWDRGKRIAWLDEEDFEEQMADLRMKQEEEQRLKN